MSRKLFSDGYHILRCRHLREPTFWTGAATVHTAEVAGMSQLQKYLLQTMLQARRLRPTSYYFQFYIHSYYYFSPL